MRANAILVRWQGGWRWVTDVDGLRIEIDQGHAGDSAEVIRKATAELNTYKAGQSQVTVGIDVLPSEPTPSVDWIEGDEVHVDGAWQEVAALSCSFDPETQRWTDVPVFGTRLDDPPQRIARTLRNIPGLNQGTSHTARPVASLPKPNVKP